MTSWVRDMVDTLPFERRRSTGPADVGTGGLMVLALALGAAGMYLFDPELGAGRRARLRTMLDGFVRRTGAFLEDASREAVGATRSLGIVRRATPPEAQSP